MSSSAVDHHRQVERAVSSPRRRWRTAVAVVVTIALTAAIAVVAFRLGGGGPGVGGNGDALPDADLRSGRVFIQDNLWTTDDAQYATWVDGDGTPYVAKRAESADDWQVVDLGDLPGNPLASPTVDDTHNVNVLAVDADGYIHVMGNMHNDPLRYVRSTRPGDITEWEPVDVTSEAAQVTYPTFATLPDGTLLFFRREDVPGDYLRPPLILLDALRPGADDWEHVGTLLDGRPTKEGAYLHRVAVDQSSGAIHIVFMWRATPDPSTNNDVSYARSDDGGRTWHTSNGRELALPITHPEAEIVLDTVPQDSGLLNQGGMTVDAEGRPHAVVRINPPGGDQSLVHLWFDGSQWQRQRVGSDVEGRPTLVATPDGRVWLLGSNGTELRLEGITPGRRGDVESFGRVPAGWEPTYDSRALELEGTIEVLVPDGDEPQIATVDPG